MRKWTGAAALLCAVSLASCGGSETLGDGDSGGGGADSPYRIGTRSADSFAEGSLLIGQADLAAGGSTSLSLDVVDEDGALAFGVEAGIGFNSDCIARGLAAVEIASPTTTNGSFNATYTATGCNGADEVTAYVTIGEATLTAKGAINVQSAQLGGLEFVSAEPAVIGMSGSPLPSQSSVVFLLRDSAGVPLANRTVNFSLSTAAGGLRLTPTTVKTDAGGQARTVVQAGSVHTEVRVTASTSGSSGQALSSQSDLLVITTGLPDQDSFTLGATKLAVDGNCNGASTLLSIRAADRYNNPVPKGTAISFTTEGGKVGGQCTTGDPLDDPTLEAGVCTVLLNVQNPRPADGRVTILATALGEESFNDVNGNGFYDAGVDIFNKAENDLPEAFVDYNENGRRDANEPFTDRNGNSAYDAANNAFDGYVCDQPGVSCRSNVVNVRDWVTVVFSNLAEAVVSPTSFSVAAGKSQSFTVSVADRNGNSFPAETKFELSSSIAGVAFTPSSFGPFNGINGDSLQFTLDASNAKEGTGTITLKVTSPDFGCGPTIVPVDLLSLTITP